MSFELAYFPSCTAALVSKQKNACTIQRLEAWCAKTSAAVAVKLSADDPREHHVALRLDSLVC